MIRFIIKKTYNPDSSVKGATHQTYLTADIDVPELERILTKGGFSQYGCEHYELTGVEILKGESNE